MLPMLFFAMESYRSEAPLSVELCGDNQELMTKLPASFQHFTISSAASQTLHQRSSLLRNAGSDGCCITLRLRQARLVSGNLPPRRANSSREDPVMIFALCSRSLPSRRCYWLDSVFLLHLVNDVASSAET